MGPERKRIQRSLHVLNGPRPIVREVASSGATNTDGPLGDQTLPPSPLQRCLPFAKNNLSARQACSMSDAVRWLPKRNKQSSLHKSQNRRQLIWRASGPSEPRLAVEALFDRDRGMCRKSRSSL